MPVIDENLRMAELRRLGVSEPLMRLAAGECIHAAFRHACLGPPFYVYHGAGVPDGPLLVPLWDHGDTVQGVWQGRDGLEFIEFSIETPDEFERLATTEQGFWVTRFDFLYECDLPLEALEQAAAAVGFRFLDQHLASREAMEEQPGTFSDHRSWLRGLVVSIDSDAVPQARS